MTRTASDWHPIETTNAHDRRTRQLVSRCARALEAADKANLQEAIHGVRLRSSRLTQQLPADRALLVHATVSVLCDLVAQGWGIRVSDRQVAIAAPEAISTSVDERKEQVRLAHRIERDAQLRTSTLRHFVRAMEQPRLVGGHWRSILSLMRDGRELAAELVEVNAIVEDDRRLKELARTVAPYVQVVGRGQKCAHTGLLLTDIWRYFRHTWNTPYQSTPGRHMAFLVRDAAATCHPVIGIGALGSSIVQLSCRDQWIGWSPDRFLTAIRKKPSTGMAKWVHQMTERLISDIWVGDFIAEKVLTKRDLRQPSDEAVTRLRALAKTERRRHERFPRARHHKSEMADIEWRERARTPLFRSKRALALAELLAARQTFQAVGFSKPTRPILREALKSRTTDAAIRLILRRVKASYVGVRMMDITVCGAVAPYNELLGGKLVGLLAASPAMVTAYRDRYRQTPSIIASSLKGEAVRRSPSLVLLGTTSLYDAATSQYNRLRMPAFEVGGAQDAELRYVPLGRTVGYGSFHFSEATLEAFAHLLARRQHGRKVNSIFGEGVNPKLRKVREALDTLGLPSDVLLRHGSPRLVFGVPLASNFREMLIGLAVRPRYIIPQTDEATDGIINFWRRRWLAGRVLRPETLERVAAQSLVRPLHHGARVILPDCPAEDGPLFEAAEEFDVVPA